jgi:AraC-like DNA-binding protein
MLIAISISPSIRPRASRCALRRMRMIRARALSVGYASVSAFNAAFRDFPDRVPRRSGPRPSAVRVSGARLARIGIWV